MNTEAFMSLWSCETHLRQFIVDQAKRHSSVPETQEDYVQEAWFAISLECGDSPCEYYEKVALRAIQRVYQRERRYKKNRKKVIENYKNR